MPAATDDKGLEDAAILMMSLGEEQAAEVLKLLAPKEVQRLGETLRAFLMPLGWGELSAQILRAVGGRFCGMVGRIHHRARLFRGVFRAERLSAAHLLPEIRLYTCLTPQRLSGYLLVTMAERLST